MPSSGRIRRNPGNRTPLFLFRRFLIPKKLTFYHRRPLEEDRVRRLRFALCTAASAPFLPWRRREHTHAGFLRSHRPTGAAYVRVRLNLVLPGARPMRRTSTSPPSPSRISEADFTGTPSKTGDLTRVVSGIIGAERLHSWGVWSCTRAGTPLPAPPSRGTRVCAMLSWLRIILSHKILWLRFFQGVFRVFGKAL